MMPLKKNKNITWITQSSSSIKVFASLPFISQSWPHSVSRAHGDEPQFWPVNWCGSKPGCLLYQFNCLPEIEKCSQILVSGAGGLEKKLKGCVYDSFWAFSPPADRAAWSWMAYRLCSSRSLSSSSWNVGREAGSLVGIDEVESQYKHLTAHFNINHNQNQ